VNLETGALSLRPIEDDECSKARVVSAFGGSLFAAEAVGILAREAKRRGRIAQRRCDVETVGPVYLTDQAARVPIRCHR
jgi:hypothetical protein